MPGAVSPASRPGAPMSADLFAPGSTASPPTPASMRSKAASTSSDICPTSLAPPARRSWKAALRLTCPGSNRIRTQTLKASPTLRRILRRATPRGSLCNSRLSLPFSSCRRASAQRSCFAMSSAGHLLKQHLCSAVPPHPSTVPCSGRARRSPIATLTAGRRLSPSQLPRSKSSSGAICRLGKATMWTASWLYSRKMQPPSCRRGCSGLSGARVIGTFFAAHGRPVRPPFGADIRKRAAGFCHL